MLSVWGPIENKERYHYGEEPRNADAWYPCAALAWASGPQTTLRQPRMSPPILLIFGVWLLLHELYIRSEWHHLSMQALDWDGLDELPWQPDLEVLLSRVYPTGNPLARSGSAHVVVLAVDGEIAPGSYCPRKGPLMDMHEPAGSHDDLGNSRQGRKRWEGHTRRLIAAGACLIGTLLVVVVKKGLCHLMRFWQRAWSMDL